MNLSGISKLASVTPSMHEALRDNALGKYLEVPLGERAEYPDILSLLTELDLSELNPSAADTSKVLDIYERHIPREDKIHILQHKANQPGSGADQVIFLADYVSKACVRRNIEEGKPAFEAQADTFHETLPQPEKWKKIEADIFVDLLLDIRMYGPNIRTLFNNIAHHLDLDNQLESNDSHVTSILQNVGAIYYAENSKRFKSSKTDEDAKKCRSDCTLGDFLAWINQQQDDDRFGEQQKEYLREELKALMGKVGYSIPEFLIQISLSVNKIAQDHKTFYGNVTGPSTAVHGHAHSEHLHLFDMDMP